MQAGNPEESFTDDFARGYYIGQIDPVTHRKSGLGIRIYLKEDQPGNMLAQSDKDDGSSIHMTEEQPIDACQILSVYEGEWKGDLREGKGWECYKNKDVYIGFFHHNQREGKGKMSKYATGETYTGEWYQSQRHGYGSWRKKDSQFHYSGMWSNNKPWGYGILRSHSGDVFEGNFYNGYKHGAGVETYKNGGSFIGNFRNGQPEGHGRLVAYDGGVY